MVSFPMTSLASFASPSLGASRQVPTFFEELPVTGMIQEGIPIDVFFFEVLKIFTAEQRRFHLLDPRKQRLVAHFSYHLNYL